MDDVVNKVAHTVKRAAKSAGKGAKKLAGATKQAVLIKAKDSDLREKLEMLGRLCYAYSKNENSELKSKIDICLKEIDELNAQIISLKSKRTSKGAEIKCNCCGAYVSAKKEICPNCKATLERIEISLDENE